MLEDVQNLIEHLYTNSRKQFTFTEKDRNNILPYRYEYHFVKQYIIK